jgi:CO/xanthine dehydrogenase FAD-binding subunit
MSPAGMGFLRPATLTEALEAKAEHPDALPIAGGTDVMVELNFDRRRPPALLDLTGVSQLREWVRDAGAIRLGAGVSYTRLIDELAADLPGLAIAARTVGSPQIRNRGTVGGNLGAGSPAGDSHPPLLASRATVEVASVRGIRRIAVDEFYTGVKHTAVAPDELIVAILVEPAPGPQQFAKIGTRNAMVIAVCSFGLALHPEQRKVGACVGSAAPTPVRARYAEGFIEGILEERDLWESREEIGETTLRRFGEMVEMAANPISDVRGTAAYRIHAVGVLARRSLKWAWSEYRDGR